VSAGHDIDMVWAEGVPPEVEERLHFATGWGRAAVALSQQTPDDDPYRPLADANLKAARGELTATRALLSEFWEGE
jgi:hypothetical protein